MAVVATEGNLQILKKLVPLNLLSEGDLEQLLKSALFKQNKAGGYLFRQGDTDYHNVYLLSGLVSLLDGAKEVDRVSAGSETARFPLAHQIPRKNSARALGNIEYVLIDNRKLSELLVRSKDDDYKVADINSTISDDWMAQLLQSRVFQQIPASNIQGVIMRMEEIEVKRGEKVVRQGGEGDYFYLIHQGRCSVTRKEDSKSKAVELAKLGPGDSFGEEALLSDSVRNSTVTMLSDGVLLRLAKGDFIEFVKRPLANGVSYSEAKSLVNNGTIWLDVRPPEVYEEGHLQNSVNFPLDTLRYQASNLAQDRKYVICCDDGHVSATAAYLLTDRGFAVSVLEGGLRTVPSGDLIKEQANKESSAKVISLRPGEETAEDKVAAGSSAELDDMKKKMAAANARIKDLGIKFQSFRERQQREEAKQLAEIKAQKVIIDKNRIRLEELKNRREADRRLIEQLQQETGDLTASLHEATEKVNQAKGNVADLEAKLKDEFESRQSLAAGRDEHKKQLDSYQVKLKEIAAEKEALEEKLSELRKGDGEKKQRQDQALSEAEQLITQLRAELEQVQNKNRSVQSELDQSQERYLAIQSELNQFQEKYQGTQSELDQVQEKYQASQSELNQARERYLTAQSELDHVQDKFWATQSELDEVKTSLQETAAELDSSLAPVIQGDNEEVGALREEIRSLTEALTEADLAYDQIREQAEAIAEEKVHLLNELQKLEDIGSARRGSGELYEDVVTQVFGKAEEESLRQELEDLRNLSQRLEQRVNESEKKCASLEDALEDRDKEIDRIQAKLDEEKAKIVKAKEQYQQREDEISQLRKMMAQSAAASETLISQSASVAAPATAGIPVRSKVLWGVLGSVFSAVLLGGGILLLGMGDSDTVATSPKNGGGAVSESLSPLGQRPLGTKERTTSGDAKSSTEPKAVSDESAWRVLNEANFGPAMIRLKGASFMMGSNRNQVSSNEWPEHEVKIGDFAISKDEVTFDEYERFAKDTGRSLPKDEGWGRGSRPVINISWDDAVAYTKWLSERTGATYRLPSEAEWEFALRSGSDATYWWGYQMEEGRANCFDCGSEWDRKSTAPVASFSPNNFGLHDMAGNVREWVMDCYQPNFSGAPTDGSAWVETACKERVVRGGAYDKTSDSMRSSWRGHFKPDAIHPYVGFRVVREL